MLTNPNLGEARLDPNEPVPEHVKAIAEGACVDLSKLIAEFMARSMASALVDQHLAGTLPICGVLKATDTDLVGERTPEVTVPRMYSQSAFLYEDRVIHEKRVRVPIMNDRVRYHDDREDHLDWYEQLLGDPR